MKKASRNNKLMVGAFVMGIGLLAVVATLFFGDDLKIFTRGSRYYASFKNTSGLHLGAPLKMGGVDIGTVESIAITTDSDTPRIMATLMVYAPHDKLIKADSEVALETQGMLGDKYLNMTTGSADAPSLAAGNFIRAKESTEISAVVSQSTDIIKTVASTTAKVDTFVTSLPNASAMKAIAEDFQASARELRTLLAMMNAKDSGLRTLSDQAVAARVHATLANLDQASFHLNSVATKIDSGSGTLGALVNDPALYDDMRKLMGRANRSKAAKFIIQQMLSEKDAAIQN